MASAQFSASLSISVRDVCAFSSAKRAAPGISRFPRANLVPIGTTFVTGSSPLLIRATPRLMKPASRATPISIRCEERAKKGDGLDVWLGRIAMVGFAVTIFTEVTTGKGFLENFGLAAPLPTVILAVMGLAGVVAAIFIFQSSSENDFS